MLRPIDWRERKSEGKKQETCFSVLIVNLIVSVVRRSLPCALVIYRVCMFFFTFLMRRNEQKLFLFKSVTLCEHFDEAVVYVARNN